MSRYVVVGAGAVGASIAAELHRAGVETLLVARGAHLAALRARGLSYLRPDGGHQLRIPVAGGPGEVELTGDDVLLLATKSTDTEAAAGQWAWQPVKHADGSTGLAATDLPVVTLQNGLANERTALRFFARVIGATIWIPATFVVPGEVVNHGTPAPATLWLGHYPARPAPDATAPDASAPDGAAVNATAPDASGADGAAPNVGGTDASGADGAAPNVGGTDAGGADAVLEGIAADLRRGGFVAQVVADVVPYKANKLLGNLLNTLDALYAPSELRDTAVDLLRREGRAVYAAAGIVPADPPRDGLGVADVPGRTRAGNSTRQSLARSAVPETDYLDGEIVLLGRLHGVPTPATVAVQARLHRAVAEGTPAASLDDADLAATLPELATTQPDPGTTLPGSGAAASDLGAAGSGRGAAGSGQSRPPVLISAAGLHEWVAQPEPPLLLDVRWALGDPHGERHYLEGHLPGAGYVDLDTELSGPHTPGAGRHPLPPVGQMQEAARRWGLTQGRPVVVYDNSGGMAAARAWWLLRWAGVTDVRLLDGGLAAWRAAGYDVAAGHPETHPTGDVELTGGHLPTLTADEAAALPATGTLLDARAAERYRGDVEPIDPRAGHIPGAVSAPTGGNLRDGVPLFKTPDELRVRFAAVTGPVGVYCGSGVTAAHTIAALAVAGIDATLYPGSWSAWSADPARPVATGDQPSGTDDRPPTDDAQPLADR